MAETPLRVNVPRWEWLEEVERCLAFQSVDSREGYLSQVVDHASRYAALNPIRVKTNARGCVAYLLVYPGKLAMVGGVAPASDLRSEQELNETAFLLRSLVESVRDEVELTQAVTFPAEFDAEFDAWRRRCFQIAGFQPIAVLKQCALDCANAPVELDSLSHVAKTASSPLSFVPWTRELDSEFVRLVDQTYDGTWDVPELNGVRSTSATLEGYARTGLDSGSIRKWWLIGHRDHYVGCLLVCRHSPKLSELLYLGIVPEVRGKGVSGAVMKFLLDWCREQGVGRILLAVDARNTPALKLYERFGFEDIGTAEAWFAPFDRTAL
jgi:GNAT superfamily N-acetyltransferase